MLLRARWVLPVSSDPLEDGAVVVRGALIHDVGPVARLTAAHPAERVRDLGDAILMPGFVNAHAHVELTLLRGLIEDLPFHPWLRRLVALKRDVLKADEEVYYGLLGAAEMIRAGVTTVADCTFSGTPFDVLAIAGLRGIVYQEAFAAAPQLVAPALAQLEERLDALEAMATPLLRPGVSPHSTFMACGDLLSGALRIAERRGLHASVHVAESPGEDAFVRDGVGPIADAFRATGWPVQARGMSPVAWLAEHGWLESAAPVQLVHLACADDGDLDRIGRAAAAGMRVGLAACPRSNARLGNGLPDLAGFERRGIPWGLGTDSAASAGRCDLFAEMSAAMVGERGRTRDVASIDARRLLAHATLASARSLGLDHLVGSLEVGKQADLCAVSLASARMTPAFDPSALLVHCATPEDVVLTMVAGDLLYDGAEVATIDEERVRARCRERADLIAGALSGRRVHDSRR